MTPVEAMAPQYTRRGSTADLPNKAHPGVALHRWHAYDCFSAEGKHKAFDTKESRRSFLGRVADLVERSTRDTYPAWHGRFDRGWAAAAAGRSAWKVELRTDWRLAIGWATNPALETGLALHPIRGFPYLPGSAVRGALKAAAEAELLDDVNQTPGIPAPGEGEGLPPTPPADLEAALPRAHLVRAIFGSLSSRRNTETDDGPPVPFDHLQAWLNLARAQEPVPSAWESVIAQLRQLCGEDHLGGLLSCFDAVPAPDQHDLLEVDILNPHYKAYYDDIQQGGVAGRLPSDDKDPVPLYFLTVAPNKTFEFRFTLRWPVEVVDGDDEGADDPGRQLRAALAGHSASKARQQVDAWLVRATHEWGIGAKTTAGYGYFRDKNEGREHAPSDARGPQESRRQPERTIPGAPPPGVAGGLPGKRVRPKKRL